MCPLLLLTDGQDSDLCRLCRVCRDHARYIQYYINLPLSFSPLGGGVHSLHTHGKVTWYHILKS